MAEVRRDYSFVILLQKHWKVFLITLDTEEVTAFLMNN